MFIEHIQSIVYSRLYWKVRMNGMLGPNITRYIVLIKINYFFIILIFFKYNNLVLKKELNRT